MKTFTIAVVAPLLIAAVMTTASHADAYCTKAVAFRVCRALHSDSQVTDSALRNCISVQQSACVAVLDLTETMVQSTTPQETTDFLSCAGHPAGVQDWVARYDCAAKVVQRRNQRIYARFLEDRGLTDPKSLGAACTSLFVVADDLRKCLGDLKPLFPVGPDGG